MDLNQERLVGEYKLGPRIGSGSFAVVWLSKHRQSGIEVAVKEIDKKLLSPKVSENLLKEISILSTISHPNIIRLYESIQTEDRIFLVLEYCGGGDLAAYIHRHGKVSETVARHFMRQLAAGLQVLQENHLIHRDLKPQNLLLSSNEATPQLKIGDFGFARSLTPQDLADTLCGSPLYMAPEIIQNQKYDAKADLWSVGAILFQLVTGKPPFDGNSQYQLFQNILTSTELCFPQGSLEELHPDCVDLCRSLLRQNPVVRLTFKEFFNHKFLVEPRQMLEDEPSTLLPLMRLAVVQSGSSLSDQMSSIHLKHPLYSATRNPKLISASVHGDMVVHGKEHGSTCGNKSVDDSTPNIAHDRTRKCVDDSQCLSDQHRVADSMESIEEDYVVIDHHFDSMEDSSYYLGASLINNSTTRVSVCASRKNEPDVTLAMQFKESAATSSGSVENPEVHKSDPLATSVMSSLLKQVQGPSTLHPSTRLHSLHQSVQAVSELAQEKYNEGRFLESFSVELVVLAIWKTALEISSSWLASSAGSELPESSSAHKSTTVDGVTDLPPEVEIEFVRPSSAYKWAEQGFIAAFDRAEKLSYHLRNMDATAEMPDAMEIIFEKALAVGKSGAADDYMKNMDSAAVLYSKAMCLLSFIVEEATLLPLNPPFSLTPKNKKRIQSYIMNLQSRQSHSVMLQPFPKQYSLNK